jgi:hypothetical protein
MKQHIPQMILVLMLAGGSLGLAIVDPNYRVVFADIAKVGIGGWLGYSAPQRQRDPEDG